MENLAGVRGVAEDELCAPAGRLPGADREVRRSPVLRRCATCRGGGPHRHAGATARATSGYPVSIEIFLIIEKTVWGSVTFWCGSYNLSAGTLSSVLKILFFAKILCQYFIFKHYFSLLNTFMRKGKDSNPDPCLWQMHPDPKSPKTCGSGSGSPTLMENVLFFLLMKQARYLVLSSILFAFL